MRTTVSNIETNNSPNQGLVSPSIRIAEDEMYRLGALADSCMELFPRVAQFLSQEVERRTLTLTTLLEPLLILMMGGIVLMIVLAVMLPIIEINQLVA